MHKRTKLFLRLIGCTIVFVAICAPDFLLGSERSAQEVLTTNRFRVHFDGIDDVAAVEVRGLISETVDNENRLKPVDVVIVRLVQAPDALWDWRVSIMEGKNDKRSGWIEILRSDGTPAVTLSIIDAWPVKWVWPTLNAEDPRPALEEIHIRAAEVGPLGHTSGISSEKRKTPSIKKLERDPFKEMEKEIKRNLKREKEPQN